MQAASGELLQYLVVRTGHGARCVDVFDSHQPLAAVGAGVEPTGQSRHQRARMQWPGRRGRKAPHVAALRWRLHVFSAARKTWLTDG